MNRLAADIRFTLRSLARRPGFALTAIITLALGVGATTAIFSVVDGVLLRPLPYADAEGIVVLWQHDRAHGIDRDPVSAANFMDWQDRNRSFTDVAAIEPWGFDYQGADGLEAIGAYRVSEAFFRIVGTAPLLGRTLQPQDFETASPAVVVMGYGLWQRRFGGDSSLVGRALTLDGAPMQVVGIMPRAFDLPPENQLWAPRRFGENDRRARAANYYNVAARLRDGVSVEAAQADMDRVATQLAQEYPATNAETGVNVVPLDQQLLGSVRTALLVLLGAVAFVLLIACVNVANLLLARGSERGREFAIRTAMGCGHRRLTRQLVTEHLILALLGGAAGVALAFWGSDALLGLAPDAFPRMDEVGIDGRILAFSLAISVVTALVFGMAPVVQALRLDPRSALGDGGRGSTAGRRGARIRQALVVLQLAMAFVLLAGAGLMGRSFLTLLDVDPGYRTDGVVSVTVQAWGQYPSPTAQAMFVREATDAIESLPEVRSAGMTSSLPLTSPIYAEQASFVIQGRPAVPRGQEPVARGAAVTAGYFATLGTPLRAGRLFGPADDATAPRVVVVNEALARRHWQGEDPLGETIMVSFAGPPVQAEVVGVVGNMRHRGLDDEPQPGIFLPHAQWPTGAITFVAHTVGDPAGALNAVRERLWTIHSGLAMGDALTLSGLLDDSLRERRFYLFLLAVFSAVAAGLAAIGVYGLIGFTVRTRSSEIGIRVALGARPQDVLGLYTRQGAILAGAGLAIGFAGALVLTRLLRSLLYGVAPTDPIALLAAGALLGAVAVVSAWLPARRATRVEPVEALRAE